MKKIISLLLLMIIAGNLFAQEPCNDEIIMAMKGKWTNRPNSEMVELNAGTHSIDFYTQKTAGPSCSLSPKHSSIIILPVD